jgi:hypothetical protein
VRNQVDVVWVTQVGDAIVKGIEFDGLEDEFLVLQLPTMADKYHVFGGEYAKSNGKVGNVVEQLSGKAGRERDEHEI